MDGEYIEPMFGTWLTRSTTIAARLRWPSQCLVCRAWPSDPLCQACIARFTQSVPRCATCALAVPEGVAQCGRCLRQAPPLAACLAAVSYGYPWDGLITDFKFHGQPARAAALAALLRGAPHIQPALDSADLLLPMPLAPLRLRTRGYNQALLLARQLSPERTDATLLLRLRDTPPQTRLDRTRRARNMRGAFALDPLRAHEVRDRHVLLVDDVMTSGASLFAAAQVLNQAGAARVTGLAVARTEEPNF